MTRVLIGAALALVVLLGAALAAPSFIDWNQYRDQIAARVEEAVGRAVIIGGDVDFHLLPSPSLSATQVRIANPGGASMPALLQLGALDIKVAFAPLLRGDISVRSLVLQDPVFELEMLADGRSNWSVSSAGQRSRMSVGALARNDLTVDSIVVRNGSVTFRSVQSGTIERVTGINANVTARSLAGPYIADGTFSYRAVPARFAANTSAVADGRPVGLRVEATFADSEKVELRGTLSEPSGKGVFTGTLAVDGANLAATTERWRKAFQSTSTTPVFAVPFHLGAQASVALAEAGLNDIDLRAGNFIAQGALNATFGPQPRIDATFSASQLDVDAVLARIARERRPGLPRTAAAPFALPSATGTVELAVEALTYRGRLLRNVEVAAALADGAATISHAHGLLPGLSDLTAKGTLVAADGKPQFDGDVTATSDNLRDLLTWLGADVSGVPAEKLRTLQFQGKARLRPDLVQAYGFNLRFDTTVASGGAAYAFRARPAFSIDVDIDRFDLDAYLGSRLAALNMPLARLDTFDTDLRIRAGEITVEGEPAHGVVLDVGLLNGALTVRDVSVADFAGAKGKLGGIATGFATKPGGAGTVNIAGESVAAFARVLKIEVPGVDLSRLGAFTFNANLDGDRDRLRVDIGSRIADTDVLIQGNLALGDRPASDLVFQAAHANVANLFQMLGLGSGSRGRPLAMALNGTASGPVEKLNVALSGVLGGAEVSATGTVGVKPALAYKLEMAARHPDASAYVRDLGLRYQPRAEFGAAALRASIEGTARKIQVAAAQASLGDIEAKGTGSFDRSGAIPVLVAAVEANKLPIDRFFPPQPPQPRREWSSAPLPLAWARRADLAVDITAGTALWQDVSYQDVVLGIRSQGGVVNIGPARAKAFGGEVDATVTVGAGPAPMASVSLALTNIDLEVVPKMQWAVMPISGRATVRADVTSQGASERELVANAAGTLSVVVAEGMLRGVGLAETGEQLDRLKDVAELPDLLVAATNGGQTLFKTLELSARAADGVLGIESLAAQLEGANVTGGGTIDLPRRRAALDLSVALLQQPQAPAFTLELSGPWEQTRRLPRSRELQAYVARRLADRPLGTLVPTVAPRPEPPQAPIVPAPEPIATAPPPPAPPQPAPVAPAPAAPAPEAPPAAPLTPFEQQMRGFLQGLAPAP